jgi:hypothetical protein
MDDIDAQDKAWDTHRRAMLAVNVCPYSLLTIPACKASICDCFEFDDRGEK